MSVEQGSDRDAGFGFIGAVHELLSATRTHRKTDLLLAAVIQILFEVDRGSAEITRRLHEIWPGVSHPSDALDEALAVGQELGLITRAASLGSTEVWTLTKDGTEDAQRHVSWLHDLRARAQVEILDKARAGLDTELTPAQADTILGHLTSVLAKAIRSMQAPYVGHVDALLSTGPAGKRIVPNHLDREALLTAIGTGDDPTVEFTRGLAMAAIDPLDSFGNELVSHITAGCILHAFVAGVDRKKLLDRIGSPSGQRAVLDTPFLIDLLGPKRVAASLEQTIRSAIELGWEVVALEHSIDEAQQVLTREVPEIRNTLRRVLREHTQQAWYASLAEDQLPALCVEVLSDGTYTDLDQLLRASEQLAERLEALGVSVRPHGNSDEAQVSRLRDALESELVDHKGRSEIVLQRDAETMAVIARRRRRPSTGRWPGGWVITKDRYMAAAYSRVIPSDRVSATIRAVQWSTLLAVSAQPGDVEVLARAAAEQFVDEVAWSLPIRYPLSVAAELARQLSPEHGGSDTDVRVAQMTLDEALDSPSSATIASAVLSERARRLNQIHAADKQRLTDGLHDAEGNAAAANAAALDSQLEIRELDQQVHDLASDINRLSDDNAWLRERAKRVAVSAVGAVFVTAIWVAALIVVSVATKVIVSAGLLITAYALVRWCTERNAKLWMLLVGALIDAVGTVSGLRDLLTR